MGRVLLLARVAACQSVTVRQERKVISFARSPVISKITRTSAGVLAGVFIALLVRVNRCRFYSVVATEFATTVGDFAQLSL